jgi:uncharacterized membrane protein YfcA
MIIDIDLPVLGLHVEGIILIIIGLLVGVVSGFFGIGGGIIVVPLLFVFLDIPFNVAIGSSLALIIGTCISGTYRHRLLGNVRYRIGIVFMFGSFFGVEFGANALQVIMNSGSIILNGKLLPISDIIISGIYIVLLSSVGLLMYFESKNKPRESRDLSDCNTMEHIFIKRIKSAFPGPYIKFRDSDMKISVWMILILSVTVGFVTGLLGVGGGFLLVPAMVYLMNLRTKTAIGTSLFSIILSSLFGTYTHTVKGNVDIVLVIILLIGSTIGAQFGAIATRKFRGPRIRFYFSVLTFLAAFMSAIKLCLIVFQK